ncbi:MAG: outer membrane beta-barrel protein [Gemmatimonadaceae bacterium]
MIRRFLPAAFVAVCVSAPLGARAQIFMAEPSLTASRETWSFDVGGQLAQPIGGFKANVDAAWGIGAAVRYRWFEPLAIRGDATILNYGNERKRVPLSETVNRVVVDMTTSNNIAVFSVGPELMVPRGPIRPYVYAFAGYSYFFTESSVGDDHDGGAFASSTNFHDGGLATGWGGGLRVPLRVRKTNVAIDAGARRTRNGTRSYLRHGDIIDQPDGSMQFTSRTSDADFWQYHLGVSFAPSGRGR